MIRVPEDSQSQFSHEKLALARTLHNTKTRGLLSVSAILDLQVEWELGRGGCV